MSDFHGATKEQRAQLIAERFPVARALATEPTGRLWDAAFREYPDMVGDVLRDILKLDTAQVGRSGARKSVDLLRDTPALERLAGDDPADHPYSYLPFGPTLRILLRGRTLRDTQKHLGIARTRVHRFLSGEAQPTTAEMEAIAAHYNKQPGYFLEYRLVSITAALVQRLQDRGDTSVRVYERLYQRLGQVPPGSSAEAS